MRGQVVHRSAGVCIVPGYDDDLGTLKLPCDSASMVCQGAGHIAVDLQRACQERRTMAGAALGRETVGPASKLVASPTR